MEIRKRVLGQIFSWVLLVFISIGSFPLSAGAQPSANMMLADGQRGSEISSSFFKKDLDRKISVNILKLNIEQALRRIADKSELKLSYQSDIIIERKVTLQAHNIKVSNALNKLLKAVPLDYRFSKGRYLFIIPQKRTLKKIVASSVSGIVKDSSTGNTLPGVNILVKGTSSGTATDKNGHYKLDVPSLQDTLVFSFVGYETRQVPINGRTEINVKMELQAITGQEMVVVGYGTQKRENLTGSISSVSSEDLNSEPINSVDQGLAGKAAGVQVTSTSGQPGATASVKIRGSNSLQAGNQPLYVIDGLPIYPGSGTGPGNKLSPLATLNPQDIESIEILKDASATSIYGSRGSNGVVLITTKSGGGKDQISLSVTHGFSSLVRKLDVLEAYEYANLINEAYTNDGMDPYYSDKQLNNIHKNGGTDWQDEVYQVAQTQNYNLNFAGGDEKTVYSISGNYQDAQGIISNSSFKRYNARLNLTRDITDNFRVSTSITANRSNSDLSETGGDGNTSITYSALRMNPVQPVYQNKNATPPEYTLLNAPGVKAENPVASANELVNNFESNRLLGNIYAEYDIFSNLTVKAQFGVDLTNNKTNNFTPDYIQEGQGGNIASINNQTTNMWINENTINYKKTINEKNSIDLLGGITFQKNIFEGSTAGAEQFVNNKLEYYSLEAGTVFDRPQSGHTEWSLNSYLGRIRYNYDERYLITLNGRIDGSSRFGQNNKYGFFPSAAVAWRLTNEDFIQELGVFSNLKLRASYGTTGNQEFNLYQSLSTLGSANYTIGGTEHTGFYPNKIANKNLKWEKTNELDIGLNLGFFNNRLQVTSDYYYKKTNDLIYSAGIPWVSGFGTSLQNIGSIQNQGLELAIQSNNIVNSSFNWTSNFNISFTGNKVLSLGGERYKNVGAGSGHLKINTPHRLEVGKPISVFYGFVYDGIYQTDQEVTEGPNGPTSYLGGRRYKDISGPEGKPDGSIDATYDRTIIGNPHPEFYGGLKNSFLYKGFQLDVFLQFNYGNDIMDYNRFDMELPSGGQNVFEGIKNHWSEENRNENVYPIPTTNRSQVFSSRQIEDGSYLKIKNITFGYNFPHLISQTKAVKNMRLYFTVTNYFTFTGYSGYDPDISFRGVSNLELGEDYNQYPKTKTIQIGLKLGL